MKKKILGWVGLGSLMEVKKLMGVELSEGCVCGG